MNAYSGDPVLHFAPRSLGRIPCEFVCLLRVFCFWPCQLSLAPMALIDALPGDHVAQAIHSEATCGCRSGHSEQTFAHPVPATTHVWHPVCLELSATVSSFRTWTAPAKHPAIHCCAACRLAGTTRGLVSSVDCTTKGSIWRLHTAFGIVLRNSLPWKFT